MLYSQALFFIYIITFWSYQILFDLEIWDLLCILLSYCDHLCTTTCSMCCILGKDISWCTCNLGKIIFVYIQGRHWGQMLVMESQCQPCCNLEQLAKPRRGSTKVQEGAKYTQTKAKKHPQLKIWQTIQLHICFCALDRIKSDYLQYLQHVLAALSSVANHRHICWFLECCGQSETFGENSLTAENAGIFVQCSSAHSWIIS